MLISQDKQWKEVNKLIEAGKPVSAKTIVDQIYDQARQKSDKDQIVKSLMFLSKLQNEIEEDHLVTSIKRFENYYKKEKDLVVKSLLANLIAKEYNQYLNVNGWRIQNRSSIQDEIDGDIQTYSVGKLIDKSNNYFLASIQFEKELKKIKIDEVQDILIDQHEYLYKEADLYLILCMDVVRHFNNTNHFVTETNNDFILNHHNLFGNLEDYLSIEFENQGAFSKLHFIAVLFQNLLKTYTLKSEFNYLKINVERLRFMKSHSAISDGKTKYKDALQELMKEISIDQNLELVEMEILNLLMEELPFDKAGKFKDKNKLKNLQAAITLAGKLQKSKVKEFRNSALSAMQMINKKELHFINEKVIPSDQEALLYLTYRNLSKLNFKIIKFSNAEFLKLNRQNIQDKYLKIRNLDAVVEWEEELPSGEDHVLHSIELVVPPLPIGQYMILAYDGNAMITSSYINGSRLHVSDLAYDFSSSNGYNRLLVVDRNQGIPQGQVDVQVFYNHYNRLERRNEQKLLVEGITNDHGIFELITNEKNARNQLSFRISNNKDFLQLDNENAYLSPEQSYTDRQEIVWFTDRAIYRPGQIVHYKGILLNKKGGQLSNLDINKELNVLLRDANYQELESQTIKTDEFGSFYGTFVLPNTGLNGNFTIETLNRSSRKSIRVEEYKRPKFQPEFVDSNKEYKLGDSIVVNAIAKSFAGISMEGAKYNYTVYRQSYWPRYKQYFYCGFSPLPQRARTQIKNGSGFVGKDGLISLEFIASMDKDETGENNILPSYYFNLILEVVDLGGETHSINKQYNLNDKAYLLETKTIEYLPKGENANIEITVKNFDNQEIDKKGTLILSKVESVVDEFREKLWDYPEFQKLDSSNYRTLFPYDLYSINEHPLQQKEMTPVKTIVFDTGQESQIELGELPVGQYMVKFQIDDEVLDYKTYFQIFNEKIVGSPELKIIGGIDTYKPDDLVDYSFVGNFDDQNIFYSLYEKGKLKSQSWIEAFTVNQVKVSNDSYGNMILKGISFKHNRVYQTNRAIKVPWEHKKLEIEYVSFRDKIKPGRDEEFAIKIKNPTQSIQMTLAMYDESLDSFVKNTWTGFNFPIYSNFYSSNVNSFGIMHSTQLSEYTNERYYHWYQVLFPRILYSDHFGGHLMMTSQSSGISVRGGRAKLKNYAMDGETISSAPMMDMSSKEESLESDMRLENLTEEREIKNPSKSTSPPIRENLDETVFFFPSLVTDSRGELSYRFKMKEAITRWKLLSFAHNKELQFGLDERSLITTKDVLIQANMPRFLRAGDQISFSAKVSNLSESSLIAETNIEIIDAISGLAVDSLIKIKSNQEVLSLEINESKIVEWTLSVSEEFNAPVIIKVFAKSGNHYDGEQNMLPVLTNRKLITSTKSMLLNPNSETVFEFDHLLDNIDSKKLKTHHYQLEFTNNPIWFAIKAIPFLKNIDNDNTMNIVDQLFGNSMAQSIINKYPKIKVVFDKWKNDPTALQSELSKNKDLKSIALKETPWIRNSQTEEQQRRDLALLFDLNMLSNQQFENIEHLMSRQGPNGGFSWRSGGRDSWHVTQYVLELLLKLKYLGILEKNQKMDQVIERGMQYVDARVSEYYKKNLKGDLKNKYLSPIIIHYSYLNSMYHKKLFGDIGDLAKAYFRKSFKDNWQNYSPYMQAMIAISHLRAGELHLNDIIKASLLERVIRNESLGSYWKLNNAYSWNNLAIEQQAAMIEYFEEVGEERAFVDELKKWLLTKKQTTHWPTSKSTVMAIYSLVHSSPNWIHENKIIDVWVGGEKQTITNAEAGTGHFQLDFSPELIDKKFGTIKLKNENDHLIWGSAYWQYWQDLDEIKSAQENPFRISKKVFVEETTDSGSFIKELSEGDSLQQGDMIIVRIELRTDRDLDYVHMQDMRAAGFEPLNTLSQYKAQDGLWYYESTKDRFTDFFFERLNRGTYVFEYKLRATHKGDFSNGITLAECLYAPSFSSHSIGNRYQIKN